MTIYVVKQGDTIFSISQEFKISQEIIISVNQLIAPFTLALGQALLLVTNESTNNKIQTYVNGYAYTFIDKKILDDTLPYLSYLSVFSYGFDTSGNLLPPKIDDEFMINSANNFNVSPLLTLTPLGPDGNFNNNLINSLVQSEENMDKLIKQIIETVEQKGFKGVDVDFEFILAKDKDKFTAFVDKLTKALNPLGYLVFVALAPKTSADQTGIVYEGKDYKGLGEVSNGVLLMAYEWGYKYSNPRAIAPVNLVRDVVEYAVTEIPNNKISLGIPNYAYDWPLPYEKEVTEAKTIGVVEAMQTAIKYNAEIMFDEIAQSPYFNYKDDNGIFHEVWFEDVRSMQAKFDLVKEFKLRGMGYWNIMSWFFANWVLLEDNFIIL